jgi:hypothetical protein
LAPLAAGSIPMEKLFASARTREELRALMNEDLGPAAGRVGWWRSRRQT